MLDGVEHDQETSSRQVLDQKLLQTGPCLRDTDRFGKLGGDKGRILHFTERNKKATVRKGLLYFARGLQGQSGLSDASRPGQRQQPYATGEQRRLDAVQFP